MISYHLPDSWIKYNVLDVVDSLTAAKAAVLSLTTVPYQRNWAEELHGIQLKREVAGTSRIEGADFTEKELEAALVESPDELYTRSQRQAAAAVKAYRWIAELPVDRPINERLVCEIHRLIVQDADDDHCPPGKLRSPDQNVLFGSPRYRGVEGGEDCRQAFSELCRAAQQEFQEHDPLIQGLAFHYHLAAMHPFLDGNGRTARAVEALMLQRVGLRDTLFIAMSNYYYEEKTSYLARLAEVRESGADLTPFLNFALRGIEVQCLQLFREIKAQLSKALFRNTMYDLFGRLRSARKRAMQERQIQILKLLLKGPIRWRDLLERTQEHYKTLSSPTKALIRDINYLLHLGAISYSENKDQDPEFAVRLEWPTEITETEFFEKVNTLPKAKTHKFL